MTEQRFRDYGMKGGPAVKLVEFAKECKDKKKRAFSSYRSLKEVLAKYGIDGNGIGTIRQFPPPTYKLEDDDEELVQCIKEIKRRKRKSGEAFGEDFDYIYGIVTTASEWYFILFASDGISSTSKDPLNIRFSESALKEGSEEEKDLCNNVKRVMEVIVGLLKDRLECMDEEPDRKKARIEGYRSKK
ncbi:hypothetical protein RhiirA1_446853 [Rhizophagus irregularis]|uniref:Uncharacterized protein n=1 Tax=Rhizophagus irregularis TaxID=588596 RepID=A0A2N0QWB8_9GLOM|nr:hypothetical protein RhiirA1_446853 [Rhizophagus irregularis]